MESFLKYYKKISKLGKLPDAGLCNCLPKKLTCSKGWVLVCPTQKDIDKIIEEGYCMGFWASNLKKNDYQKQWDFGETRKFVLLFAAAINGEFDK